jgi:regulator of sigma E protease
MTNPVMPITMLQAVPYGVQLAYEQGKLLVSMPVRLIQGQVAPEEARFVGPKGMYDIYAQARERDSEVSSTTPTSPTPPAVNTLYLMATISVALGMTNLFPIPALDGGRIIFIIPEILLRRRVPAQYENMVHLIGFAALILLMVYITTQDFVNPIVLP